MSDLFYISCQPGLESDLVQEIQEVYPWVKGKDGRPTSGQLEILEVDVGGVTIRCDRVTGFQFNELLKTASRVLLRLKSFHAHEFPSLVHQLKKVSFKEHLQNTSFRSYKVSCSKSKLNNEKRVEQVLHEVFGAPAESSSQDLYVRVFQDEVTISLDTSGDHLHFRGWRTEQGEAPIRETLAAWAAYKMIGFRSRKELSKVWLLDPTSGSGTLLIEAERLYQRESIRSFAYQNFSSCPQILRHPTTEAHEKLFAGLIGLDINPTMQSVVENSSQRAGVQVHFKTTDFLNADIEELKSSLSIENSDQLWIMANPPYNMRLETDVPQSKLADLMIRQFWPDRLGIFSVTSQKLPSDLSYQLENQFELSNGGIKVLFSIFNKSKI